ncbi:unnamed protein product [Brachionus calyciflorus]|uniref:Uncharacterized protein n=1 Tax=Brachionus calyciflorus TaxID=104777 RepID=A0A813XXF9_9BILA|nr:unnamed protein product [Brachionus calyciflorus]
MKYLGIWIDERLNSKTQFNSRIKLFNLAFQNLKRCGIVSNAVDTYIKLCFYKTYTRPMLYYGMDNLVMNKDQTKSMQTLESKLIK